MRLRPLDYVILALTAAAVAATSVWAYSRGGRPELRVGSESGEWIYPLDEDRVFSVAGPLGATTVAIEGGEARILDSPCPNKTCVASPPIGEKGRWIACLPNRVILRVEGASAEGGVDASVY